MAHSVDGYELKFTSRTSWKAERRQRGRLLDIVPVTWTKDWHNLDHGIFLHVHFTKSIEAEEYSARSDPFVVAVAKAKDYNKHPHDFEFFTALYSVMATGTLLNKRTIETRVLDRLKA